MSGSWVFATFTRSLPACLITAGSVYELDQIGSDTVACWFCWFWLEMNLMYAQASAGCSAPFAIITGWPPLHPGALPVGPAGVWRIPHWPATLLCFGSFAVA